MVTRRAVLKGTAAASIGAIAAAHGAVPAAAAALDVGYGELTGGAVGGFYKYRDAFQVALKFQKFSAEIFFKEDVNGLTAFFKFFDKHWTDFNTRSFGTTLSLDNTVLSFSKIDVDKAEFFLKDKFNDSIAIRGTVDTTTTDNPIAVEEWQPPDGCIT